MTAETKAYLKRTAVGCVKILSFLLVLAILLEVLSLTYFSKKGATHYKTSLSKAYSFLQEPDNSIDVLCIGNSDLYSAVVPADFWTQHGFTSTVIASPHQTPRKSYGMLKTFFEHQSPQIVVIETDMLYEEAISKSERGVKRNQTIFEYLLENFNAADFDELMESHFSIFTFHDKWKKIGKPKKAETPNSHGYKYSDTVQRVAISKYMTETEKAEAINPQSVNELKRMIALCEQKGCKIVLAEMPTLTSWNTERHNAVAQLSVELGYDFIDYNLLVDEIGMDLDVSFRDVGNHLNYSAARKVTKHLGAYLANSFELADRRNDPDYEFYQKSIDEFFKEVERERKKRGDNLLKKN